MIITFIFCSTLFSAITVNGKYNCDFSPTETELKLCRYRDEGLFPPNIWKWRTGEGCYSFFQDSWFSNRINISTTRIYNESYNCTFPIGYISTLNRLITFDYENDKYSDLISASFSSPLYYSKWRECSENAIICCNSVMDIENIYPSSDYPCPTTWDAWSCFTSTKNNSINKQPCHKYISSSEDVPCTLYSEKECYNNGTWNQITNYGTCATAGVYRKRHSFHIISLYVSIVLSLPAIFIFISYKNLRILRVNLHRNLLIACILRNVFTILTKELIILDELKSPNESNKVLINNSVGCRVLTYVNNVFTNAIYACMLIDGYYLHKLIVRIFHGDPNPYILYVVTAVLSFVPSTVWAIVIAFNANYYCWVVDTAWYHWITDGYRIAILSINVILLLDIIRVLCSKLRKNATARETKYCYTLIKGETYYNAILTVLKSTLKATIFLLPLFGVPFILLANRNMVNNNSCVSGDIYYYTSYLVQALQAVMVATVFCYWNKEVHNQIKRSYETLKSYYNELFDLTNKYVDNQRNTAASYVPSGINFSLNDVNPPEDTSQKVES
ncbi:hypothetical protein FQA39_LY17771 [Lamprigera yunnana]|nr:hypothetical protein FQA39_LY17771 [Lamprigera yunnana]